VYVVRVRHGPLVVTPAGLAAGNDEQGKVYGGLNNAQGKCRCGVLVNAGVVEHPRHIEGNADGASDEAEPQDQVDGDAGSRVDSTMSTTGTYAYAFDQAPDKGNANLSGSRVSSMTVDQGDLTAGNTYSAAA
jgi:hypothetical protein